MYKEEGKGREEVTKGEGSSKTKTSRKQLNIKCIIFRPIALKKEKDVGSNVEQAEDGTILSS